MGSPEAARDFWEIAGDLATAIVIIGVVGEFCAEFTNIFSVSRNEIRRKRLAKTSTLVLIVGLAGELLSHNRATKFSQQINAVLNENAASANKEAAEARKDAAEAAKNAARLRKEAETLRRESESLRRDTETEKLARLKLQSQTDRLKRQVAFRTLTEDQKTRLLAALKIAGPQQLYFVTAPDPEATSFADQISAVLKAAGWKTELHPSTWGTVEHYPEGVEIMVADITKPVVPAVVILQKALSGVGIEAPAVSFFMVEPGKLALFVGLKPKTKE